MYQFHKAKALFTTMPANNIVMILLLFIHSFTLRKPLYPGQGRS